MSSPESGVIHSPKASDTSPTYGADDEESRLRARLLAKKAQSSRDKVEKSPPTTSHQQPRSVVLPTGASKSAPKSPSRCDSSKHHHHHHKKKKKRRTSSENDGDSGNKVAAPLPTIATKKAQGNRRVVEIDDDIQNVINAKIAERLGSSSSSAAKISGTEIFDVKSRDNDDVVKNVSDEELESLGPNIQPPQASRKMTKSSEKYYHRDSKRRGEEISPEGYPKRRHLDAGYGPSSSYSKTSSRHVSLYSSVEARDKQMKSTAKTSAQENSIHRRSREISSSREKYDLIDDRKKRYEKQPKEYDTKKYRIESKRHRSPGNDEKRSRIESISSEMANEKERQNRGKNRRRASEEGGISSPSPAHVTTPTQDELEDKHEHDQVEHAENPSVLDANSEISTEELVSGSRRRKSRSPSRGSLESGEQRSDDDTEKKSSNKKQKYSKFESSSSESDCNSDEVGEAEVEIKEDKEIVDHSENEDNNQEVTTPVHESEPEGPIAELESEDDDPLAHLQIYFPGIMGCRNVNEFHNLNRIEEGTYGVVYRAVEKRTGEIVALKRLKMEKEKEGFPITSLREINMLLKAGQCENIVKVREIVVGSNMDQIYLVMDYVEHDLKSLMETMSQHNQHFLTAEIKTLMQQFLNGVAYLHDNWILHRDLKTSNLLLSHRGILQIGDFGLAREYGSPLRQYTPIVVTLWYRAPELLLGISQYSSQIDMWSVGCIMAEMLTLKPFFTGKGDIEQLSRIFKVLGTPNDKIWPGYSDLPGLKKASFVEYPINSLRKHFGANLLSEAGLKLLNDFLTYDPKKRITAQEALKDEAGWFREEPRPVPTEMFPTWPAKSERMSGAAIRGIPPRPGHLQRSANAASPKAASVAPDGGAGKRSPVGGGAFGRREITASASDNQLLRELKISGTKPSTGFSLKFDRHIF